MNGSSFFRRCSLEPSQQCHSSHTCPLPDQNSVNVRFEPAQQHRCQASVGTAGCWQVCERGGWQLHSVTCKGEALAASVPTACECVLTGRLCPSCCCGVCPGSSPGLPWLDMYWRTGLEDLQGSSTRSHIRHVLELETRAGSTFSPARQCHINPPPVQTSLLWGC